MLADKADSPRSRSHAQEENHSTHDKIKIYFTHRTVQEYQNGATNRYRFAWGGKTKMHR